MTGLLKTPFTYTDADGNSLIVDRQPDALTFATRCPGDTMPGPEVRIPLHSLAVVFSHLITTATATTVQEPQP